MPSSPASTCSSGRLLHGATGSPRPPLIPAVPRWVAWGPAPAPAPASTGPDEAARASWRLTFAPSAALLARGINVDVIRGRLREAGRIVSAAPKILAGTVAFEFLFAGDLDDATIALWREDGITAQQLVDAATASAPVVEPDDVTGPETASRLAPSHVVRVDLTRLDELMRII